MQQTDDGTVRSEDLNIIRRRILAWYKKRKRILQWRFTTDPYEILVSEIMLQQTQVSRVKTKLPQFLKRFPDFSALASAPKSDVVKAWKGMGYNNRAVRLHEIAKIIITQHNGTLPDYIEELRKLPGIGKYTSHAVACFSFRQRVPVVDVNIRRVLSRVFWKMKSPEEYRSDKDVWLKAGEILPRDAYTWNQALMDFGATVCTARNPLCPDCPVNDLCLSMKHMQRSESKQPGTNPGKNREPMYDGIPRRFWRGRVIEALRNLDGKQTVSLTELGKRIKKDFHKRELPWLADIIVRLNKDGVVTLAGKNRTAKVSLSHE
jgi:A/G-specific adenine glycosylase